MHLLSDNGFHSSRLHYSSQPLLKSLIGLGGARIPYHFNTALVPAALRSLARLSQSNLFPTSHSWNTLVSSYAEIWEDEPLSFFTVSVPIEEAKSRLQTYVSRTSFSGPSQS